MDEIWERAVGMALDGQRDVDSVRTLTLDGAVKCVHGRLPSPSLFEKFHNLQHLSMASIGVSSLEQFPRVRNLQKLILSDNRIAGGLEFLVEAALESLRDLDLSNNRISDINVLKPLAELRLVSLDLYECPVTRVKDYRSRVFGLIRSLKYLDKMDVEENERPESDEEEEEEDDEDDQGSGEIDGEDHLCRLRNEERVGSEGVVDVDEDEESDADEEAETSRRINGLNNAGSSHHHSNGFRVEPVDRDSEEDDDDSADEVYEDDDSEDEELTEVHEIGESDDGEEDDDDDEDDEDEEELDNDEIDFVGPESRLTSTEGEIDAHEQGVDDDVETGEEEQEAVEEDEDFEDDEDEEDEYGLGYLVQPVERMGGVEVSDVGEDEDDELLSSSSSHKRKRDGNGDEGR